MMMIRRTFLALSFIATGSIAASAQAYDPSGVQFNVNTSTVLGGGWTQCYVSVMATYIGDNAENVLGSCNQAKVMMAGRFTGSDNLLLLAEGPLGAITQNTGATSNGHHAVNGAEWYFAPNWSWGFGAAGDNFSEGECDTASGADRMCLHTVNQAGGYRIGDALGLNGSTDYEKVFYESDGVQVDPTPEPASFVLFGSGLLALAAMRKRNRRA